jgi:hypothetical protein
LPRTDGRTVAARRFRALIETCEAEFGAPQSSADSELYTTWAGLTLHREHLNAALVRGEPVDNDAMIRNASETRRVWSALKAKAAKAKAPAPNLHDLLAEIAEAAESGAEA